MRPIADIIRAPEQTLEDRQPHELSYVERRRRERLAAEQRALAARAHDQTLLGRVRHWLAQEVM